MNKSTVLKKTRTNINPLVILLFIKQCSNTSILLNVLLNLEVCFNANDFKPKTISLLEIAVLHEPLLDNFR